MTTIKKTSSIKKDSSFYRLADVSDTEDEEELLYDLEMKNKRSKSFMQHVQRLFTPWVLATFFFLGVIIAYAVWIQADFFVENYFGNTSNESMVKLYANRLYFSKYLLPDPSIAHKQLSMVDFNRMATDVSVGKQSAVQAKKSPLLTIKALTLTFAGIPNKTQKVLKKGEFVVEGVLVDSTGKVIATTGVYLIKYAAKNTKKRYWERLLSPLPFQKKNILTDKSNTRVMSNDEIVVTKESLVSVEGKALNPDDSFQEAVRIQREDSGEKVKMTREGEVKEVEETKEGDEGEGERVLEENGEEEEMGDKDLEGNEIEEKDLEEKDLEEKYEEKDKVQGVVGDQEVEEKDVEEEFEGEEGGEKKLEVVKLVVEEESVMTKEELHRITVALDFPAFGEVSLNAEEEYFVGIRVNVPLVVWGSTGVRFESEENVKLYTTVTSEAVLESHDFIMQDVRKQREQRKWNRNPLKYAATDKGYHHTQGWGIKTLSQIIPRQNRFHFPNIVQDPQTLYSKLHVVQRAKNIMRKKTSNYHSILGASGPNTSIERGFDPDSPTDRRGRRSNTQSNSGELANRGLGIKRRSGDPEGSNHVTSLDLIGPQPSNLKYRTSDPAGKDHSNTQRKSVRKPKANSVNINHSSQESPGSENQSPSTKDNDQLHSQMRSTASKLDLPSRTNLDGKGELWFKQSNNHINIAVGVIYEESRPLLSALIVLSGVILSITYLLQGYRMDVLLLSLTTVFSLLGIIDRDTAFNNLGHPIVITLIGLFSISHILYESRLFNYLSDFFLRGAMTERQLLFRLAILSILTSSLLSNILAITVLVTPALIHANRLDLSPKRILLPLSFFTIIGGCMTSVSSVTTIAIISMLDSNINRTILFSFDLYLASFLMCIILSLWIIFVTPSMLTILLAKNVSLPLLHDKNWIDMGMEDFAGELLPTEEELEDKSHELFFDIQGDGSVKLGFAEDTDGSEGDYQEITFTIPQEEVSYYDDNESPSTNNDMTLDHYKQATAMTITSKKHNQDTLSLSANGTESIPHPSDILFRPTLMSTSPHLPAYQTTQKDTRQTSTSINKTNSDKYYDNIIPLQSYGPADQHKHWNNKSMHLEYCLLFVLHESCPYINRTPLECSLIKTFGLRILGISNIEGEIIYPPDPYSIDNAEKILSHYTFSEGDVLKLSLLPKVLCYLRKVPGLKLSMDGELQKTGGRRRQRTLAEVLIHHESDLVQTPLESFALRKKWDLVVLGVRRWNNPPVCLHSYDRYQLKAGDILLVEMPKKLLIYTPKDFSLIANIPDSEVPRVGRYSDMIRMCLSLTGIVAISLYNIIWGCSIGLLAVLYVSLVIVLAIVKATNYNDMYKSLNVSLLLTVAGSIGVSIAIQNTGLLVSISRGMLAYLIPVFHSYGALLGCVFLTIGLCSIMPSNVVVLIVGYSIIQIAEYCGLTYKSAVIVLIFTSNCFFLTPFGTLPSLYISTLCPYKLSDYFKIGLPLQVIAIIVTTLIVLQVG